MLNLKKIKISKIPLIFQGIISYIFKSKEKLYKERFEICSKCEQLDKKGDKCAVKGTQPCCGVCGCSLALLLRSKDSECELKKW